MYNHQCPCCLRGTLPNDYCNTRTASTTTRTTTKATDFNHKHIAADEHTEHRQTTTSTPQNRKIFSSNELLPQQHDEHEQSSKYFDVRCQNLAIYSVSDPLHINSCKRSKCCRQLQNGRNTRINQLLPPSNCNQINCNRCCCSCCSVTASPADNARHQSDTHRKIDENSILACSNNNSKRHVMTRTSCNRFSDDEARSRNDTNMSRDSNCKRSKQKELGIWTELLNNSKRKVVAGKSVTRAASIFSSIFLLFTLLPSFTLGVPKVGTAYACEDKTLTIECEPGDTINIIRANFGRFSLTICNDHGNVDWSVNCMSQKSLRVLNSKCTQKQNCSVSASASLFGDPCPGTRKYLEANYRCESAIHTTTVTNRLSPPPWQVTSQPSVWSTSTIRTPTTSRTAGGNQNSQHGKESPFDEIFNGFRLTTQRFNLGGVSTGSSTAVDKVTTSTQRISSTTEESFHASKNDEKKLLGGGRHTIGGLSFDDTKAVSDDRNMNRFGGLPSMAPTVQEEHSTPFSVLLNTKNGENTKNYDPMMENFFCSPTMVRNLFWNVTRAGDVNVQPCPGGATGIAKWRCVLASNLTDGHLSSPHTFVSLEAQTDANGNSSNLNNTNAKAVWYPATPDLSQCRSLWLNSLEIRVNQRDSSLISIANDLSQVTSSKTLYGGDMLVTTKIIQTMSEKMTYDIETFPDQRQRETTVTELLHGVVKTGSNLLDQSQEPSWHDLSFEDQMRVATSLLTGLEDNAFLLADTINRERNVVQKVKNILLSVRILETRNIAENEVFPDSDSEQWDVSDDQIEIPKGALIENNEGGLVRIVFVAFDRLESILKPATIWMDSKLTSNTDSTLQNNGTEKQVEPRKRILNSKVISASLGKGRHIQLSQPIRLTLRHLIMENVTNPSCVFWNYIDHAWSDDGCYVETTNRTHTSCMCNHLTNFAILMDVVDDIPTSLLSMLDDNLRILIYISISISILLLVVAIITLKMFNGLLIKSCRTTIYRNLYICLLFIEILFLIGIELSEDHVLCGFASAFLHCSFLSATGWIFFEGYQLYLTLTSDDMLLEVEKSSRILWYYLFTYGLAFLIVTISIAIDPFVYTRADYCVWMEQTNVFWSTFITPIIIFIVINLVYSAMAINVMNKKYTNSLKTKEHTRLASASCRAENVTMNKIKVVIFYLRCSFIFLIIFILNWLFAFMYMKNQKWKAMGVDYAGEGLTSTYGYLFIFFNTFQGVYIFVFHCIQNEKIRREYCKFAQRQSWLPNCLRCAQQPSGVPSTSSNVAHQLGNGEGGPNHLPVGTLLPSGVPGGQLIPTGATIEAGGTLSRHPQMGTKGKRMIYGIDGMPETGTLRGQIMPMGSQTSPMSSTGSTQLIYNGGSNARHLQEWAYQHPDSQINKNAFDERLLYYDTNAAKSLKQSRSRDNELHDDGQSHEVFHWTQGRNKKQHRKHPGGPVGSAMASTLSGSNRDIYPSYHKKHPHDHQMQDAGEENSYLQNYRRYMQAEADAEFLSQYQRQLPYNQAYPGTNHRGHLTSQQIAAQRYYQQHGSQYIEEPVYEEIVSSQMGSTYGGIPDNAMIQRNGSRRMSDDEDDSEMDDDDMEVESDNERFPNGATDEEDSGSRSNKDDLSSRQSSSRPLIKSSYDYNQTAAQAAQAMNGQEPRQNGNPSSAMPQQRTQGPGIPSRNLSAILDENNTVVCYLEPLSK
ncbi:latrophilin Cirl [Culicoides brevitarsis]|uniref:latrophilin Cirl n=1 Tax=Culicoides brevitarsis TaxID=469753 RepID=UPI00307C2998